MVASTTSYKNLATTAPERIEIRNAADNAHVAVNVAEAAVCEAQGKAEKASARVHQGHADLNAAKERLETRLQAAQLFIDSVFRDHEILESFVSDRASRFVSAF